jgi:hypothetical protein
MSFSQGMTTWRKFTFQMSDHLPIWIQFQIRVVEATM